MYTIRHLHFRVRAEKVDQKKKIYLWQKMPASEWLKELNPFSLPQKERRDALTMVDKNTFMREEIP